MKRLFSLMMLSILLITPAYAQSSDASLIKARQLMTVMNVEKTLTQHMSDADDIQRSGAFLISKIAEANPDEESKIGDVLVEADRRILPQIVPGYVGYMAELYAGHFSPQELDQLIAFYKTDAMQSALHKSSESTEVVEFNSDQRDQSNAFLQTSTGKKLQRESPLIMKQLNIYAADVIRKKQRDLVYAALREDLPKNGLKVPDPFAPDTFIDKTIHDNVVKANSLPSVSSPAPAAPQQSAMPQQAIPLQGVAQSAATAPQPSFTQMTIPQASP